jgi:hypothetical protein
MYQSTTSFSAGESLSAGEKALRWMRSTRQLDFLDAKLRTRIKALTQLHQDPRDKAAAIYRFVHALPFMCEPRFTRLTASEVLQKGGGDCMTKGILFVAMLRGADIPARLRFVSLPVHFLRGVIELDTSTIVHAMAEVHVGQQWWLVDSYVPDLQLQIAAQQLLTIEERAMGYGIHRRGATEWDGCSHSSAQCSAEDADSLPTIDWGHWDDPESFYEHQSNHELRPSLVMRLKWRLAAPIVNKRTQKIRALCGNPMLDPSALISSLH